MSVTGYYLYRGKGTPASVDFDTPVAFAFPGDAAAVVAGLGHEAGAVYTYVLRPVLDGRITPDLSCATEVGFDAAGAWGGRRPAPVEGLTAEVRPGGVVRLSWRAGVSASAAEAASFAVFVDERVPVDVSGAAVATVAASSGDEDYAVELTWPEAGCAYGAVIACADGGGRARPVTCGPVVADASTPAAPRAYADAAC